MNSYLKVVFYSNAEPDPYRNPTTSQFCSASLHTAIYPASLGNHAFHSRFSQRSVCDVSTLDPVLHERYKQSCYELGAQSGQSTTLNSEEARFNGKRRKPKYAGLEQSKISRRKR